MTYHEETRVEYKQRTVHTWAIELKDAAMPFFQLRDVIADADGAAINNAQYSSETTFRVEEINHCDHLVITVEVEEKY